ncbi:MAG: hypothetical protein ABEJ98_02265 [Candidatus Nanohaloarchaea archaeon]
MVEPLARLPPLEVFHETLPLLKFPPLYVEEIRYHTWVTFQVEFRPSWKSVSEAFMFQA